MAFEDKTIKDEDRLIVIIKNHVIEKKILGKVSSVSGLMNDIIAWKSSCHEVVEIKERYMKTTRLLKDRDRILDGLLEVLISTHPNPQRVFDETQEKNLRLLNELKEYQKNARP